MRAKSNGVTGVEEEIRYSSADLAPISTIYNSSINHVNNDDIRQSPGNSRDVLTHEVPHSNHNSGLKTDETHASQGHPNHRTPPYHSSADSVNRQVVSTSPKFNGSSPIITVQPEYYHKTSMFSQVPDYTALSIIVLLCLCLPFGLIAYIKASKSKLSILEGNLDAALVQARESRNWSIAGIVCFVVVTGMVIAVVLSYVYVK